MAGHPRHQPQPTQQELCQQGALAAARRGRDRDHAIARGNRAGMQSLIASGTLDVGDAGENVSPERAMYSPQERVSSSKPLS